MPRPDLADIVAPEHTAVVTQECQGAIVGPDAALAQLGEAARREAIPNLARLLPVARAAGVGVVHCLAHRRADGLGSNTNARLFAGAAALGMAMEPGSPGGSVVPELGPEPSDMILGRWNGVGPTGGTDLDPVLRNMGVRTIVITGVSVNVAIQNATMDAVNLGYQVVLPRDAVAGIPDEYAQTVIDNTLSLLATVTTTDELIGAWS